jgi:hypothetical protein
MRPLLVTEPAEVVSGRRIHDNLANSDGDLIGLTDGPTHMRKSCI